MQLSSFIHLFEDDR